MLITIDMTEEISRRMFRTYAKFADKTGITMRHVLYTKKRRCADVRHGVRFLAKRDYQCTISEVCRAEKMVKHKEPNWATAQHSLAQWDEVITEFEPEFAEMVEGLWHEAAE